MFQLPGQPKQTAESERESEWVRERERQEVHKASSAMQLFELLKQLAECDPEN